MGARWSNGEPTSNGDGAPEVAPARRRQDPRRERTPQRLIAAARVVFERDGFHDARLADVTKEANVSTGTLYNYFQSKEELFRAVMQGVLDELTARPDDDRAERRARPVRHARRGDLRGQPVLRPGVPPQRPPDEPAQPGRRARSRGAGHRPGHPRALRVADQPGHRPLAGRGPGLQRPRSRVHRQRAGLHGRPVPRRVVGARPALRGGQGRRHARARCGSAPSAWPTAPAAPPDPTADRRRPVTVSLPLRQNDTDDVLVQSGGGPPAVSGRRAGASP